MNSRKHTGEVEYNAVALLQWIQNVVSTSLFPSATLPYDYK